jgi:hypothetical protein
VRLSEALAEAVQLTSAHEQLRGVLVSAMPDGLLVWSWTRAGVVFDAGELAELGRAAAGCLGSLGVEARGATMTLETDDLQILALPLDAALLVHVVFEGGVLPGLARAEAKSIVERLHEVVARGGLTRPDGLRDAMIDRLLGEVPADVMLELRERSSLSLAELEWPEVLRGPDRAALARSLERGA